MLELRPEALDPREINLLVRFAPVAVLLGAAGGFGVSTGLWGEDVIGQSFWTEALKIAGIAGLPLVAIGARLTRAATADYHGPALTWMAVGLGAAVAVIMLCLHQVAVVPRDGLEAQDWQVSVALVGVGVT